MLDRSITLRIPMDLLHRLEKKMAAVNSGRAEIHEWRANPLPPLNMSDMVRKSVVVGLDVLDRDPESFEDYFLEFFADKLTATLALAASDPGAHRLLKKIVENHKPSAFDADGETDFG